MTFSSVSSVSRVVFLSITLSLLAACGGGGDGGSAAAGAGGGGNGGGGGGGGGGGTQVYTVGGTITGLSGSGLVLEDNAAGDLPVSANGSFTFSTSLASGAKYSVTVASQPVAPAQTCTVVNGSGTIASANVTNVAITCTTAAYSIGGSIAGLSGSGLILLNNGSDDLTVSTGTSFTFPTTVLTGSSYKVTVLKQPSNPAQTCSVATAAGVVANANVTAPVITCANLYPRFAYVANSGDNTVSIYSADPATGKLRNRGYVQSGAQPIGVTLDPSGRFAYVANTGDATISAFAVNRATGALNPNPGAPISAGAGAAPFPVVVDPSGAYAYTANSATNNVSAFRIDQASGALIAVSGSPFTAGTTPTSITIDPHGKFVYVTNAGSNNIYAYSIAPATGSLATTVPGSPFTTGTAPLSITTDPSGRFVYACGGLHDVSAYTIDRTSGALIPVKGSPFVADANPQSVTVDPSGRFVYVANVNSNDVSAFAIDQSSGALLAVSGPPAPAGSLPVTVQADPSGQFVYAVNNGDNTIFEYKADPGTGALTRFGILASRFGASAITLNYGPSPVTDIPKFLYVANKNSNTLSDFSIDPGSGALKPFTDLAASAGHAGPQAIAITPSGAFAYVAYYGSNLVAGYSIDPQSGSFALITGGSAPTSQTPFDVVVDPSGRFVYVVVSLIGGAGNVSAFAIDPTTRALNPVAGSPYTAGVEPISIVTDPAGKFVYVANYGGTSVSAYAINSISGVLKEVTGSPFTAGTSPSSVVVDPTGRFAYTTNFDSHDLSMFSIDTTNGSLHPLSASPLATGSAVRAIATNPAGTFAYVADIGSSTVSGYSIDPINGVLGVTTVTPAVPTGGSNPIGLIVDPSGKFAYTPNNIGLATVSGLALDPVTGKLLPVAGTPIAVGINPNGIAIVGTIQ